MSYKTKSTIRKIIYIILFAVMIFAFIYLGNKYINDDKDKVKLINDYYENIKSDKYEVINGAKFISLIKEGNSIVFIGSKTSYWSKEYIKQLDKVVNSLDIKIYYYDLNNDKAQKNSNYYDIKDLLKGSLTTTDGSNSNLLAPSLYIFDNGEVKYYNTDTVAMRNTETIETYWTQAQQTKFEIEVTNAINKYYLNN